MRRSLLLIMVCLVLGGAALPAAAQGVSATTVVRRALLKSSAANSFIAEVHLSGQNLPPAVIPGQPRSFPRNTTVTIFRSNMRHARGNIYATVRGWYLMSLKVAADRSLETVFADGRRYLRGPITGTRFLADEWYEDGSALNGALTSALLLSVAGPRALDGVALTRLQLIGEETIAGRDCRVYAAGARQSLIRRFLMLGQRVLPYTAALNRTPTSTIEFGVCDDGYPYRLRERVVFSTPQGEAELLLDVRFTSYDAEFSVAAPRTGVPAAEAFSDAPEDALTVAVVRLARMRVAPEVAAELLDLVRLGEQVKLLGRPADARWYLVEAPAGTGWLPAPVLQLSRAVIAQVPIAEAAAPVATPTPLASP
ncbi:MAG TPA: SH3 domain-containing protein [Roseiflexaceae bacterium]|nr:SH3 domain-containing protein [Roseiflexaceae bacterium]